MLTSGHVFEGPFARGEPSSALFEHSKILASASWRLKPIDTGEIAEQGEGFEKRTEELYNSDSSLCQDIFVLESSKPCRRNLCSHSMRTQFAAKDPVHMLKFLGAVGETLTGTSSCHGLRVALRDFTAKILEDAVKLGFGPIRVCTTAGQSGTQARAHWSLLFLSRCTCFNLSFVVHGSQGLSHVGANGSKGNKANADDD